MSTVIMTSTGSVAERLRGICNDMQEDEKQYCPVTSKVCFSQKEANVLIRKIKRARNSHRPKSIPQRSYRCQYCGAWHLTHLRSHETCKATLRKHGMRGSERFYN